MQTTKGPQLIFSNIGNKNQPAKNSVKKPHSKNNNKKKPCNKTPNTHAKEVINLVDAIGVFDCVFLSAIH